MEIGRSNPHHRAESNNIKMEGKNKFKIYPRGLDITWGNDNRYWMLSDMEAEDSFAELKQVNWLEVTGSTPKNLKIGAWFKVSFNVTLRPNAFGWDECNVYIMAKIGKKGHYSFKKLNLNVKQPEGRFNIPHNELKIKVAKPKNGSEEDLKLYFGMYEVWSNRWKGGLRIYHALVEECEAPKEKKL
ncbi:protein PHLOEM PROTEIN 2-LIKE A9-like [Cucurbita maxima]|uniref:Protein PHLOEM PROTEIN 2-LIKE A9-like n=1 Tax=Cucurbita maxima TaxID=3661 RepID=A0A6J1K456_CUCMA|nr:protein PHLOEM PROTEIN 2-LIKE A9-like [Cucurbita maxima]